MSLLTSWTAIFDFYLAKAKHRGKAELFRGGLGGGEEFVPISAFPFLWCVTKRKKEKMRVFQDRKILRGMLLFVVVNIWNCYNMGMKKRINRKW